MENILVLHYILAAALTVFAVIGLGFLKQALLNWSARLSEKALKKRNHL